jgi:uncharacterized membrane protein
MQSYHLTQWVLFFFIYSFIGWVWECCFVSVRKRRWVNRGFMYGPMLPIYGFGALAVLISTIRVRDSIPLIFLFGMVGATLLEYVTGAVMERLFNVKYWDYSNQKFNLNGYICLTSSLGWGFSVLLVKFVHVPIEGAVLKIPTIIAEGIAFVLTVAAAVDVTQSFNDAMDLKRILAQLEESKKQIRKIQEKLKVASEEFVEDYRQRAGEFVEDYRQRAGEFVEDYRRRVEEHVEDYRGRAEEMAEDYKKLAEEHMDSYRQRAEEMVEGYKEEIKVQKKKRREQINSRKEEYLARVHARREERQRLLARLSERAELLMKEEFTSKVDELIGEDKREEYAKIKKNISREMTKMHDRTDRSYIRAARHLKGNPTAVSKRFSEALAELRKHMDEK